MNRPLKFRAWDGEEMIYEDEAAAITTPYRNDQLAAFFADNYGCDIMQWTGLLDSEGTEVWEGDVLHGNYGIPPVGVDFPVEFHAGAFYAITTGHNPDICLLAEAIEHLGAKVIGNLFESPNLLEEG